MIEIVMIKNKGMTVRLPRLSVVAWAFLMSCMGCITNNYETFYVASDSARSIRSVHGDAPVILKTVTTEEDVISLMEDGYIPAGVSSFHGPYTPFSCAVDTAEKHGAALVLLDIRFRETQQYTSVMYLPSYSTTYASGFANVTAFGHSGITYGSGTYSGSSTTTTMNAVPVHRNVDIYDHDAMFFKKIDTTSMYGVYWSIPKRLPTEKADAPIMVRILAVLHGSRAEKDGIRRGQIVRAINGVAIKTRADIAPYASNGKNIHKMEVEDAQ